MLWLKIKKGNQVWEKGGVPLGYNKVLTFEFFYSDVFPHLEIKMIEIPEETSQIDSRAMDEILSAAALEMCTAPTPVPKVHNLKCLAFVGPNSI